MNIVSAESNACFMTFAPNKKIAGSTSGSLYQVESLHHRRGTSEKNVFRFQEAEKAECLFDRNSSSGTSGETMIL